jgi:hypothetical protein
MRYLRTGPFARFAEPIKLRACAGFHSSSMHAEAKRLVFTSD